MTKQFRFEIQNCIKVEICGDTAEEARLKLLNNLKDYGSEMVDGSCYVSDGVEVRC